MLLRQPTIINTCRTQLLRNDSKDLKRLMGVTNGRVLPARMGTHLRASTTRPCVSTGCLMSSTRDRYQMDCVFAIPATTDCALTLTTCGLVLAGKTLLTGTQKDGLLHRRENLYATQKVGFALIKTPDPISSWYMSFVFITSY